MCRMSATLEFYVGLKALRGPHKAHCRPRVTSHGKLEDDLTLKPGFRHRTPRPVGFHGGAASWQDKKWNAD
jgi:hypothetical protein